MFGAGKKKAKPEKPVGMTDAHAGEEYVSKSSPLITFRGALDHAEAEIIVTQTLVARDLALQEGVSRVRSEETLRKLQDLLDTLRAVMAAEYRETELDEPKVFGHTLDELQERSHHAQEYYGVPTMTRPSYEYGEVYAHLNLVRTELRAVERAAVELFADPEGEEGATTRPDLLKVLNRLSSAAHVLMCWWLSESTVKEM